MNRFSLDEVRRSYTAEKDWAELSGDLFVRLVHRPLSFPVAFAFLRMGVPTHAVTLATAAMSLSLPAFAGAPHAHLVVGGLAFLVQLFDCVDGTMARTRRETSTFGAVLDGACDVLYAIMLPLAIARIAYAEAHVLSSYALLLAAVTISATLAGRVVRDLAAKVTGARVEHACARPQVLSVRERFFIAFGALDNIYPVALVVLGAIGMATSLLAFSTMYALALLVASVVLSLSAARHADRGGHSHDV